MNNILNEEIERYKSLMGISESEGDLNEQPTDFTIRPKFWKGAKGFGSGGLRVRISKGKRITLKKGKPSKYQEVSSEDQEVTIPKEDWDTFLANDKQMKSLMNSSSLSDWEALKNDEDDKQYAVIALQQFNESYPVEKWERVVVGLTEGFEKKIVKGETKVYPAIPIIFPQDLSPSSNFFKDNYYQVTPLFVETVQKDIIGPLTAQLAELTPPEGKPKAFLDSIYVESSCSTLPNGPSPDGKTYTFDQLSKLRAQTALNYVTSELQKIGVLVNDTTKKNMDYMGENGDGTSGPSWTKVPQSERNAKRPEFEKYKYIDIELSVVLNTSENPTKETTPDTVLKIPTDDYTVEFIKPGSSGITIRLPKIRANWKKRIKRRLKKVNFKTTLCSFLD